MTLNRRQLLQGFAAAGTILKPSQLMAAPTPGLGSAVAIGLDLSTSRSLQTILMDMEALTQALDDEDLHPLLTRNGGCDFSIYSWSANMREIVDIVRHAPIRAATLQADIANIKDKIAKGMALPFVVGSGTDAFGGITYGHLLMQKSGVPQGNVRAINVYTDGDDDGRLDWHPGKAAQFAAEQDDVTTNILINGAERISDAMRHAAEIMKGPNHFAMNMSESYDPKYRKLMWIKKLSRDYAMNTGPSLG